MRERFRQLAAAYRMTADVDPRLTAYLLVAALLPTVLGVVLGLLVGPLFVWLPAGIMIALFAAAFIFGRRVQDAQLGAIAGQPGAAAAVMNQLRGQWFVTPAIAVNRKQDMVHRSIGRCGVVLVAEGGSVSRARQLVEQEAKRAKRAAGGAPVHTIIVGDGEDDTVQLRKLQMALTKLPGELKKNEVPKLARRLAGLDKGNIPIPKGYIPPGGRQR